MTHHTPKVCHVAGCGSRATARRAGALVCETHFKSEDGPLCEYTGCLDRASHVVTAEDGSRQWVVCEPHGKKAMATVMDWEEP